jgi:hypothetical protein
VGFLLRHGPDLTAPEVLSFHFWSWPEMGSPQLGSQVIFLRLRSAQQLQSHSIFHRRRTCDVFGGKTLIAPVTISTSGLRQKYVQLASYWSNAPSRQGLPRTNTEDIAAPSSDNTERKAVMPSMPIRCAALYEGHSLGRAKGSGSGSGWSCRLAHMASGA